MMSGLVSCGRYITGLTFSRPLLRPRWCTRTSGAPSKTPPTLPSFARNSAMVFAFQSSGSLMSNSCRSRFLGMRWDGVMDGATRTTSRSWLKPAPSRFQLHETSPHLDCLLAEPNKQFVPCTLFQCRDDLADAGPCGHG